MGTKNDPSTYDCWSKAEPDEPLFVLLARDEYAADLVRAWASVRSRQIDMGERPESERAQIKEAYQCANAMEAWRKTKRP